MSLINDALKRAQQNQAKLRPAQRSEPALQPAIVPATRSKRVPILGAVAAGTFLCFAFWAWRNTGRAGQAPLVGNPVAISQLAVVSAVVDAGPKPPISNTETPVVAASAPVAVTPTAAKLEPVQEAALEAPTQKSLPAPSTTNSGLAKHEADGKRASVTASTPEFNVYVVRSGDTLSRIARRHGTTVKALRESNNFNADRILIGQKIRVPVLSSKPSAGAA